MKRLCWMVIFMAMTVSYGCLGNQAQEWYETAALEEIQNSHDHARQLYQRIIEKYPESDYAKKARDRLAVMGAKAPQPGSN